MPTLTKRAGTPPRGATRKSPSVLEAVRAQRAKILRQLRDRTVLTGAGCLEWRGVRNADRQARITIRVEGEREALVASRVVWALHHDEDPGDATIVRAARDNPACVNVMAHCELAKVEVRTVPGTASKRVRDDVR